MIGAQFMHESWRAAIDKFVAIGTVCAYPKHAPVPFREEALWDGYSEETNVPYGLSKKMLLVQSKAYRDQIGFNAFYLLPMRVYGSADNFDPESSHVVPDLIRKILEPNEHGNDSGRSLGLVGYSTGEFFYAWDAAEEIVIPPEQYDGSEAVNIGSAMEVPIRDQAEFIAKIVGFKGRLEFDVSKPDGQPRRSLDTSRAESWFDSRVRTPFDQGWRSTIDWYLENRQQVEETLLA